MTPELKVACELVFQEHKASSHPVTWTRDAFRGRISTGLTEMAKDTLLRKNIIYYPNRGKRILTVLNPAVSLAASFEEAEDLVLNKVPSLAASSVNQPVFTSRPVSSFTRQPVTHRVVTLSGQAEVFAEEVKWYLKPAFVYVIWPTCAAIGGGLIAYLLGNAYTELFFDLKK
jgi:hypothetical protein